MTEQVVAGSYDRWSAPYAERFADVDVAHAADRVEFRRFAERVLADGGGRVADLGCGPGHWTAYLHGLGLDASGIDLSPEFVARARRDHPHLDFRVGSMRALDLPDGALAGAVAWYSLIHTPPEQVPALVAEIARVLAPGGRLLVGVQAADVTATEPQWFDHRVTPGWRWPLERLAELLQNSGLEVATRTRREPDDDERWPAGYLTARQAGRSSASTIR